MKKIILLAGIILLSFSFFVPKVEPVQAQSDEDLVARGEYLVQVAGCVGCHTPFTDFARLEFDEERLFSGGNPFDLGPLGVVFSRNLTSDEETGLGSWSDEQIKLAIRAGIDKEGNRLLPVMPYPVYQGMAESDLDAIVAYLRTVPAIGNEVPPRPTDIPPEVFPDLPLQTGLVAPDSSDLQERGRYLVNNVMACTDCHTPLNQETGAPDMDLFLSGGQPFEGPWGIVYGANITPHTETGIADWSDEDITRVLREGIRPDGRHVILMPWREYKAISDADLEAVIYYLRNQLPAVDREIPAAALSDEYLEFSEIEGAAGSGINVGVYVALGGGLLAILAGVFVALRGRKKES